VITTADPRDREIEAGRARARAAARSVRTGEKFLRAPFCGRIGCRDTGMLSVRLSERRRAMHELKLCKICWSRMTTTTPT